MQKQRLEQLPSHGIAFDVESHLIQAGLAAPPLVCGSLAVYRDGKVKGDILDKDRMLAVFMDLLGDERVTLVGANFSFDALVMAAFAATKGIDLMPSVFNAYREGRVYDILIAEKLHAVAGGHLGKDPRTGGQIKDPITHKGAGYSLATVTDLVLGRSDAKANDYWRMSYAQLEHIPVAQWPADAKSYPIDDATNTLSVALAQAGHLPCVGRHGELVPEGDGLNEQETLVCKRCGKDALVEPVCTSTYQRDNLHDLSNQCYAAWSLALGAAWGLRTDKRRVDELEAAALVGREAAKPALVARGFIRPNGSENTAIVKRAVAIAYGCTGLCTVCNGSGAIYKTFSKRDGSPTGVPKNCAICSATGLALSTAPVPMTAPTDRNPNGQVRIGRDQLHESGDDELIEYAFSQEDDKILDTYTTWLRQGVDKPITLHPDVIKDTGRVSYHGPVQLLPRFASTRLKAQLKASGSDVLGVRDTIVARPGWLFYSVDFVGGELVTHAESCVRLLGWSRMGEALNAGLDIHSALGATLMGVTYNDFMTSLHGDDIVAKGRCKAYRQAAKSANFGFPGGMRAPTMALNQRSSGPDTPCEGGPTEIAPGVRGYKGLRFCILVGGQKECGTHKVTEWKERPCPPVCRACLEVAERIRETWFKQWPENRPYFTRVGKEIEPRGQVTQHPIGECAGRLRGGLEFTNAANGYFQALLADLAKRAQCRVSYEQYADPSSVLYNRSRGVAFLHDELFGEALEGNAAECAERVKVVMEEEFKRACPHHMSACKAEPALMRRWYKAAEAVRDENGRLLPWEPKA